MKRIPPGAPSPEAGLHKPTAHPAALLERARRWVLDLFQQHAHPGLVWHQFARTNDLVAHCSTLALEESGTEEERLVLYTAAWFSYTGWLFDPAAPIAVSQQLAGQFLDAERVEAPVRDAVLAILPLADLQGQPHNAPGRILWDAALALHFGADYPDSQQLRRREAETLGGEPIAGAAWREAEYARMEDLAFHTPTGRAIYQPVLDHQRAELARRLQKAAERVPAAETAPATATPNSAIQTYFRTSYHNHIHLSAIADRKAQMLLSVNAILISVLITVLSYSNLAETRTPLLIPITLFLLFGLSSLVLAVLSARPNVTRYPIARLPAPERREKLLFFGHFTQLDADRYVEEMSALLEEGPALYRAMHRDMYHLGRVLERKFRLVHMAYTLFLVGFLGAVISFLLVHFLWM